MKTRVISIALAAFASLLSPVAFAGTMVEHGDGGLASFRASDSDTGLTLLYTWETNPGDIRRFGPDGGADYKINAREAHVVLYITALEEIAPGLGYLGEGTAHLTIFGDLSPGVAPEPNVVGLEYFNFFTHGELEIEPTYAFSVLPPGLITLGDNDFVVRRVERNGEAKQNFVLVEPSN